MDAINHVKIHPFPSPSFRTALSKPRNLSYFPLKIRSRPKKGENRPRLRTERLDSWVSKTRPAQRRHHPEGNYNFLSATASKFSSYDPPKTPSPRLLVPLFFTPPEVANTGPGVNRGSGGGTRGCGFEERVSVHARTGGINILWLVCLSVCVLSKTDGLLFKKKGCAFAAASRGMNSAASN